MKEQLKSILKSIGVYHPLQSLYRSILRNFENLRYKITYNRYKGKGYTCNFCNATYSKFVPEYPSQEISNAIYTNKVIAGYGENVFCPNCLSKNRERLVKDVLDNFIHFQEKKILHFSPEKHLFRYLKPLSDITTIDIFPGFYKYIDKKIIYGDATDLRFADNSFDIVIANHILEHIPDDRKAMKEIHRVLLKGGVALLQCPWSVSLAKTIEDPSINDKAKQAELYGQADHVRIYTLEDYIERLKHSGFTVRTIPYEELLQFSRHATQVGEPVVLAYKGNA
ncbi:methyltransferase domain-containing protein [Terrimonas sp. NA20]|uniref:Methyltransferase domain-containing protein n=1 Tax=Terrimonas ginsenosidimutans TaxID=2908004 RepID=A0ABS9KKZ8_9BACT|nr:methyltransferase domain-containing protein [Terrimonas ginsenosidimutans]